MGLCDFFSSEPDRQANRDKGTSERFKQEAALVKLEAEERLKSKERFLAKEKELEEKVEVLNREALTSVFNYRPTFEVVKGKRDFLIIPEVKTPIPLEFIEGISVTLIGTEYKVVYNRHYGYDEDYLGIDHGKSVITITMASGQTHRVSCDWCKTDIFLSALIDTWKESNRCC